MSRRNTSPEAVMVGCLGVNGPSVALRYWGAKSHAVLVQGYAATSYTDLPSSQ